MLDFMSLLNPQNPMSQNDQMLMMGANLLNGGDNEDIGSLLLKMSLGGMLKQRPQATPGNPDAPNPQLQDPNFINPKPQAPQQIDVNAKPSIPMQNMAGGDLLQRLKEAAAKTFPGDPLGQQVALTQAIHESGLQDGTPSALAKRNNFFGIKAPGTAGTVNMPTTEFMGGRNQRVNAGFGANATPEDSFNQYRDLINKSRYASVRMAKTPEEAFAALQRSGYATDPRYAALLTNTYRKNVAPMYR